jgi:glycosyltransferase involved in cell wall biosynthesis
MRCCLPKDRKILFILPNLLGGGAERVVINIIDGLSTKGYKVALLLIKGKIDYQLPFSSGVKIHVLLRAEERLSRNLFKFFPRFIQRIREYGILFAGYELWPAYITTLLGKTLGKKVICMNHTFLSRYIDLYGISWWNKYLTALSYWLSDRVITVSIDAKGDLERNFWIPAKKIKVIYNPIDIELVQKRGQESIDEEEKPIFSKPVIISVGSLIMQKGFDILLNAFRKVLDRGLEAHLVILGKGEEYNGLKKLAHQLGIQRETFFLGFKENPFQYIAKSKVFVLSSRVEGFGNVLVEAMACGCPVISTDCPGGPREILGGGKYGVLVCVEDHKHLSEAMIELLQNEDKRKFYSCLGLERGQEFAREKIIPQYIEVLQSL